MNELAPSPRCDRNGSSLTQTRNADKSGHCVATLFFTDHGSRWRARAFSVNVVLWLSAFC